MRKPLDFALFTLITCQDYMQVHGLAIWQEELCKLTALVLERELKLRSSRTRFQDSRITQGNFNFSTAEEEDTAYLIEALDQSVSEGGQTFLGALYDEVFVLTNPFETLYSFSLCGFFHNTSGGEQVGLNTFELITTAIGVCGAHALDRICQLEIYNQIRDASAYLNKILQNNLRDQVSHIR